TVPTVTNTYSTKGETELIASKAITGREFKSGDKFTFTVTPQDGAPAFANPSVTIEPTSGYSAAVNFGKANYTKAGEYTYTVKETVPDEDKRIKGLTYDTTEYTVIVKVVDDGEGKLTATQTYKVGEDTKTSVAFTNAYNAKGSTTLGATKKITGRSFKEGDKFTFTVTPENAQTPAFANPSVTIEPTSGKSEAVNFGKANYTKAGEYKYTITETVPAQGQGIKGVAYDTTTYSLTVTVTDNLDGTLTAVKSIAVGEDSKDEIVFTNKYSATGSADLKIKKALSTGDDPVDGAYEFQLIEKGTAKQTKNNVGEDVTFDTINYTLDDVGTHTYTIHESSTAAKGWTNGADVTVTVNVSDKGDGTLKVTYGEGEDAKSTFTAPTVTNTYKATGSASLGINKALSTGAAPEDGKYKFQLKEGDTVLQTKANDGAAVTFDAITYNYADIGEHTYTIHESSTAAKGWTNGADVTVKVKVEDNKDGTLKVTYDGKNTFTIPTVTNTYAATGSVDLAITKELSTGDTPEDNKYEFKLFEVIKGDTGDTESELQTKKNAGADVTFDKITYNYSDIGVHTYKIRETSTAASGWTNAPEKTVTVTVSDNKDGKLNVVTVYGDGGSGATTATNTYSASGTTTLKASKAITGRTFKKGDTFTFTVTPVGNAPAFTNPTVTVDPTTGSSVDVDFGTATFTKDGKYTYTVQETVPADEKDKIAGITYDTTVYTVTVDVTDDKAGKLTAVNSYSAGGQSVDDVAFTNVYNASGETQLSINKTLSTGGTPEDEKYQFQLKEGTKVLQTKTNDGGSVVFDKITYTQDTLGTHTYTIHESSTAEPGWINGDDQTIIVNVSDNGDGTLKITYGENESPSFNPPTITNTQTKIKVSKTNITGQKELEGAHLQIIDKDGKIFEEWNSGNAKDKDAEGNIKPHEVEGLVVGETYTLRETVAPDGYTIAADTIFTIAADGSVISGGTTVADNHILVKDALTETKISKTDITGDNELEGATLQVIKKKLIGEEVIEEWVSGQNGETVHTIKGLVTGEEYILRETVAPDGYTIATDTTFKLNPDGTINKGETTSPTKGEILLVKDDLTKVKISKVDITDEEELEGATLQILDKDNKVVETWVSGSDGKDASGKIKPHVVTGLKTGEEYTLKETIAPDGYTIASNTKFTIDTDGTVKVGGTAVEGNHILVKDAPTEVKISKTDITGQQELDGAKLQVIKTDDEGKESVVEEWVSGQNGEKVHTIKGLLTGVEYTLRETVAPDGYAITTDTTFTIASDGTVTYSGTTTQDGVLLVEDMPIVDVAVNKVWDDEDDKFGIRPQSVTVKLLADGGDTGKTLVLKEDADPAKSWTGKFEGLDMYKYDADTKTWNLIIYTVEEVNVPPGYKVTIPQPDEVQNPGDTKTFEVKNSLDLGKLDITKKLDNFYIGDGDTVKATTFAFKVEGFFGKDDQGEDKKIFETMIGIKFDGKGSNT
ncbi:MAG: Cna B-type domain-containing protein, partial [Firmicutes bacterium]|nr:Cna B-type domain-containing protein [Bacillota bacterium]